MSVETAPVETPKIDAAAVAAEIASAGSRQFKVAEIPTSSNAAPKTDNPKAETPAASDTEQPAKDVEQDKDTPKTEDNKTGEGETKADQNDDQVAEPDLSVLGFAPPEPETIETVKAKLSESSREAHRLVEEKKLISQALENIGIELVQTKEGLVPKATEKFLKEIKEEDVMSVLSNLTKEEKELVDDAVASKIVKSTLAKVAAMQPKLPEKTVEPVIGSSDVISVMDSLAAAKTAKGEAMLPDLAAPDVSDAMLKIYNNPEMESLRSWMQQSKANFSAGIRLAIYPSAMRVIAPVRAAREAAKAKAEADKKAKAKAPSVTTSGNGVRSAAIDKSGSNLAADLAKEIAAAKPR